jgi:hypothetical protein
MGSRKIGKYLQRIPLVSCIYFQFKNKKPHVLYMIHSGKRYENCPHFIGMEDE